jgi:hypothetical protein
MVLNGFGSKVNVSIPMPDPYLCPKITPISDSFLPICAHVCFYSQGCNQCKCMTWLNVTGHYSLHGNGCNLLMQIAIYNDLLWKFISNSYYFRKIYFLWVTSLHHKFYMHVFLWDAESFPNYTEKLILAEIGTITLVTSVFRILAVGINLFHILLYYTIPKSRGILIFYNRCNFLRRVAQKTTPFPEQSCTLLQCPVLPETHVPSKTHHRRVADPEALPYLHATPLQTSWKQCQRQPILGMCTFANALPPIAPSRNHPESAAPLVQQTSVHRYQRRTIFH